MPDWRAAIDQFLEERAELLVSVRRYLHAHPEPSREEFQTTKALAGRLKEAGLPFRVVPSRRGIIAGRELDGPKVALRADIDALRLRDEKEVPYRSTRDGLMHACGHDAHAAMALGAALALDHLERQLGLRVPWRAIFQPAEEMGDGAAEMVGAGAMEGVGAIVALHVDPEREVGEVGWKHGVLTACCAEFHAVVHGQGGHAARPHQAAEAILAAVQFVTAVHQGVPRSVDAREPVVVTFGAIAGGAQSNVIPEKVILKGTIRTLGRAVADRVVARMRAVARGVAEATGTAIELTALHGPEAVVNDPAVTTAITEEAAEVVGARNVREIALPSLGGEDFSAYLPHAPGCLLRLGVAAPGVRPWPLLHSPHFDIDERALMLGARILARGAVRLALYP